MKLHSAETIQLITDWLTQQSTIQLALLFGSFAKGTHTKNSDIDLAIELDNPLTTDKPHVTIKINCYIWISTCFSITYLISHNFQLSYRQ